MKVFFLVLARDGRHVEDKIRELEALGFPYLVVCGETLNRSNVVYREPKGKYDAVNFGFNFVPKDVDVVALNDVDTKLSNLDAALKLFRLRGVDLVFAKVFVKKGPQRFFYSLLDSVRRKVLIAASGELMLIRLEVLRRILPLKPCKAEDSYILFKVLKLRYRAVFCEECRAVTERTKSFAGEVSYKRKTVCGLYQALTYANPPNLIRVFYFLMPLASLTLLILGRRGYFWARGILLGLIDFLRGDRSGMWVPKY
jgi:cellulose synthase/poly-beta-1,6-N-acetylglucosamine synthase-like glycosyltransferase